MTAEIAPAPRNTDVSCVHHWIVDPAEGRTSQGRCKRCGDTRSFANSPETALEESTKQEGVPAPQPPHRWR